jgi:hypothetical protein
MPAVMEKIRVGIFMDEETRAALKAEANDRGLDMSECAEQILRDALADAIQRIRKKRQSDKKGRGGHEG